MFLFFNDTATTEIYTYCHTRSLHDSLPSSFPKNIASPTKKVGEPNRSRLAAASVASSNARARSGASMSPSDAGSIPAPLRIANMSSRVASGAGSRQSAAKSAATAVRSEEHTSELQSLMRNSSHVSCLNNKTKEHNPTHKSPML